MRVVAALAVELLIAGALRWPLNFSEIRTNFEYQLAQVVITTENWTREGAWARHFLPTRSTDHRLPEWPYYDQDYVTVPPLSFVLHYVPARLLPSVQPVVVAKFVAHAQVVAGVLIAGAVLAPTFGFWGTVVGLSFLIWTVPFFIWFIDGYFPTTTALLAQIVFSGWALQLVGERATGRTNTAVASRRRLAIAAGLAALGAWSESIALAVNAAVTAVFLAMAGLSWRADRKDARGWAALALATIAGTAVAIASVVALYETEGDFAATFVDRLRDRSGDKTGRVPVLQHAHVIFMQMRTAWPKWLVVALAVAAIALPLWAFAARWARDGRTSRRHASQFVAALWLGFAPSIVYHYVLQSHVTIHWWFAGTWTIGWVFAIGMAMAALRRVAFSLAPRRQTLRVWYPAIAAVVLAACVVGCASFTHIATWRSGLTQQTMPHHLYRILGERLPHDRYPIVAVEMGDLFSDYPFATAYLRRPALMLKGGALTLPWQNVRADVTRIAELGSAYLLYDRRQRRCDGGVVVPLADWPFADLAVCRVSADDLIHRRGALLD